MSGRAWQIAVVLLGVWAAAAPHFSTSAEAQLTPYFYDDTCPEVFSIVAEYMLSAIWNESRIAASLLRLHFHDCFVQGCDGSILLDSVPGFPTERETIPNLNSVRGYAVIDSIKAAVEDACPGVVSCADVVALSSFFGVVLTGGPIWSIPLGRRDSFLSGSALSRNLPAPNLNLTSLKDRFDRQNLTTTDLVALSGGHTIGLARCSTISPFRLYGPGLPDPTNDPINSTLLQALKTSCPDGGDGNVTNDLDIQTPIAFDNFYFQNLLEGNAVLFTDNQLVVGRNDSETLGLVQLYAANQTKFFEDFVVSMIKMGNLNVLTGTDGEIRQNCHVRNTDSNIITTKTTPIRDKKTIETPVEEMEGGLEFKQFIRKIVGEIVGEDFEMLVEKTLSRINSFM